MTTQTPETPKTPRTTRRSNLPIGIATVVAIALLTGFGGRDAHGESGSKRDAKKSATTPNPEAFVGPPAPPTRADEAKQLFGRLSDDRSVVFLGSGAPDSRVIVACPDSFRPVEVWSYLDSPVLGKNARIVFYSEPGTGVFRYWTLLEGAPALLAPALLDKSPVSAPPQEPKSLPAPDAQANSQDPSEATRRETVATAKLVLEALSGLETKAAACSDAPLVLGAARAIAERQRDAEGGLRERRTLAVPKLVAPKNSGPIEAPVTQLVSNKPLSGKERKKLTASGADSPAI